MKLTSQTTPNQEAARKFLAKPVVSHEAAMELLAKYVSGDDINRPQGEFLQLVRDRISEDVFCTKIDS